MNNKPMEILKVFTRQGKEIGVSIALLEL